jgi:GT2 family glycosyltransferase
MSDKPNETSRVRGDGKFLRLGNDRFLVRGVTYGPFRDFADKSEQDRRAAAAADFAAMVRHGFNTIRVYTVPPLWLLDEAGLAGLKVLVGLPWEQHITFLDSRERCRSIEKRVAEGVAACKQHSAILGYAVCNEIPTGIVRWAGPAKVERFLARLCDGVKAIDPESLVTCVSYPPTEYLHLPFVDFTSFNVYLDSPDRFGEYLPRLQTIAGDKPLMITEIGLCGMRNDADDKANRLASLVRNSYSHGAAGVVVFSWTDEWHTGGHDIDNWRFGLTTVDRTPVPALATVSQAMSQAPFPPDISWPHVSVVVCTRNGGRTLAECLRGISRLDYPDVEVIVVDDGSTDDSAAIAKACDGVQVISIPNGGLSAARNVGLRAARGSIIAYLDDDAYPDPQWLKFLVADLKNPDLAGVGGPNLCPDSDTLFAQCVARSPGGPVHVLLTDTRAEHLPGCNMAFRRDVLLEIGGFDEQFRIAGDDVDICWRLQKHGWELGYCHAALVWHHRRGSLRTFWKQQALYGRAEAMLELVWPEKYNAFGHMRWAGRLYADQLFPRLIHRQIRYGTWGSGLFQQTLPSQWGWSSLLASLPLMPEVYLLAIVLAAVTLAGIASHLCLLATVPLGALLLLLVAVAFLRAKDACISIPRPIRHDRALAITFLLHLLQPVARTFGRVSQGLSSWRVRRPGGFSTALVGRGSVWSETWKEHHQWMESFESNLKNQGAVVTRGGEFDRWDFSIRAGPIGSIHIYTVLEEHGSNKQQLVVSWVPRPALEWGIFLGVILVSAAIFALLKDYIGSVLLAVIAGMVLVRMVMEIGGCVAGTQRAMTQMGPARFSD